MVPWDVPQCFSWKTHLDKVMQIVASFIFSVMGKLLDTSCPYFILISAEVESLEEDQNCACLSDSS